MSGIPVPERSESGSNFNASDENSSSSRSSPLDEQFYEKYHSFKAKKAPAIDIGEIRDVFDFFDENHDGLISKDDLRQFMGRLGIKPTEEEIRSMVSSVDANGDGSVDFSEFSSLYLLIANDELSRDEEEDEDLKDAFHVFDKNSDGVISPKELQEVLVKLGMDEGESLSNCERMVRNVDSDGDGFVDFDEFKHMMSGDVRGN